MAGFATVTEEDGVALTSADVNGLTVSELRFPPGYVQDAFEPELPYLALVLDGSLEKSFRTRTIELAPGVWADDARRRHARCPLRREGSPDRGRQASRRVAPRG